CEVSRIITASGSEAPGMPPHIYYIFPESGEIQQELNEPEPAEVGCGGGMLTITKRDAAGNSCTFNFRYVNTNQGTPLTEAGPANCQFLRLTNLKWAAPIPSRMTERKVVQAMWAANDAAVRFTSLVVGVAKDGGVRSLADEMKNDHGDMNNKLAGVFKD